MTRQSRTRGPLNLQLPRNPVPVPGSVPSVAPAAGTYKPPPVAARPDRRYRYSDLRGEERRRLLSEVGRLAKAALTVDEIAKELGVDVKMLMRWCAEDAVFFEALNPDRHVKVARVEDALYKRAVGFIAQKVSTKTITKPSGAPEVHTTVTTEHVAPDPTSAALFLEVFKPEVYKRNGDNVLTVNVDHQTNPRTLAMALLAVLREAAQTTIDITPEQEAAE